MRKMANWRSICSLLCGVTALSAGDVLVEAKVGYFRPSAKVLRSVYGGGADYELSASGPVWKKLRLYGAVDLFYKRGKSEGGGQNTRIRIIPLSLGLQYPFKVSKHVDFFMSGGPRYYFVQFKNDSHFVDRKVTGSGLGGFVSAGFLFSLGSKWKIDLFTDYGYKRIHFRASKQGVTAHTIQVGGLIAGGGIGYVF